MKKFFPVRSCWFVDLPVVNIICFFLYLRVSVRLNKEIHEKEIEGEVETNSNRCSFSLSLVPERLPNQSV